MKKIITIKTNKGIKVYSEVQWLFFGIKLFKSVDLLGTIIYEKKDKEYTFDISYFMKSMPNDTLSQINDLMNSLEIKRLKRGLI